MRASHPAESAVRKSAPKFPGFSTDSATNNKGAEDNFNCVSEQSQVLATPNKPSGPSRPLIFSKAERPTSQQIIRSARQRVTSSAASLPRNISGQK